MNILRAALVVVGSLSVLVVGCGSPAPTDGATGSTHDELSIGGPVVTGSCKLTTAGALRPPGLDCADAYWVSNGNGTSEYEALCIDNATTIAWVDANANVAPWYSYFGGECGVNNTPGYVWVSFDPTCPSCGKAGNGQE